MSSLYHARNIALELKKWINDGNFFINPPAERLPIKTEYKAMKQSTAIRFVKDLKKKAVICYNDCDLKIVAKKIIEENINHVVITNKSNQLEGIVTSFDVTKAIAHDNKELKEIVTRKVITTKDNEPINLAARKMKIHEISALPVINEQNEVTGIITSEELM